MKKRSFFERLTGSVNLEDDEEVEVLKEFHEKGGQGASNWDEEQSGEGELAVDVYQTPDEVVIRTMVPGVKKEDIDISLSRDMLTIKGNRREERTVQEQDYYHRELYWGAFTRTIQLPHEVSIEDAEATENQGLLTIKLPRVDKGRQTKLKIRSA